jgi:protoporphyrinogen oxidase
VTADLQQDNPHVVLGAGPAGLTAAYALARRGERVTVLEADDQVGGLARTVVRDGYRFDLGGHRFFTKSAEVERLWHELLGDELLLRPRLSRIYWRGRFIDYPLRLGDVCRKVGGLELARCLGSYVAARARVRRPEDSFEDWVSARFGRRLFELFFRAYTEKVWGVPTSEIRGEWAAQRIRGLSPWSAVRAAVVGNGGGRVRSLIDEFHYPRRGPGQMWEAMAGEIERAGGEVRLGAPVTRLIVSDDRVTRVVAGERSVAPRSVISSLPLRTMVAALQPRPPERLAAAARGLRYRDFVCVALVLLAPDPFPDNWIYIHDPSVRVGRVQNFRAWSPDLVPRADRTCVGLEYFCFEDDELWSLGDADLVRLASGELELLGLGDRALVERGHVVRVPKAYPIYDAEYASRVGAIREWLAGIANLEQVGRNGLHRYNNSDHSMLTAIRAVENLCDGAGHDVWNVNTDSVYHEHATTDEQPYRRAPETPAMRRPLSQETA